METNTLKFLRKLVSRHVLEHNIEIDVQEINSVDPELFSQLVHEHRLELIVTSKANEELIQTLSTYPKIQERALKKIHRHLMMKQKLLFLNQLFQSNNICYAVLKGLGLNAQLYGESCFRTSGDIDLLIHENDLIKTHNLLIAAGLVLSYPLTPQQLIDNFPFLLRSIKDFTYNHPQWTFRLELHLRHTFMATSSFEPLQENHLLFCESDQSQSIPILEHHANFLYLCVHAAAHKWQRLQWLVDIAVFYQKYPLDWPKLINLAKQSHTIRPLLEASLLLQNEFQLVVPEVPHSKLDLFCVTFRLRNIKKSWEKIHNEGYITVFYNIFLHTSFRKKWRYLYDFILHFEKSAEQLIKNPNRSQRRLFWVNLINRVVFLKGF